jgi:chromosome segregation ATPase
LLKYVCISSMKHSRPHISSFSCLGMAQLIPQSAILAAIQICLGAGARRTHRATNLKELVRKEANSSCTGAKVKVTVLNRGDDGYQPDVYGDSITVERSISLRGGYNGYKLLDENGVEKSRSKKDLDAMLDQLNIQVENPVAVLDQEEAKKFLCGKPEDKYNFFTKATELERMDRAYANLSDNIEEMAIAQNRISETLKPKEDMVKALKHEYDQFQELDKLEAKVGELRVTAFWATRNEFKNKADAAQEVSGYVCDMYLF